MTLRFALQEHEEEEESSSSEGDEYEDDEVDEAVDTPLRSTANAENARRGAGQQQTRTNGPSKLFKIKIPSSDLARCKVCGATDHRAGFVGATYLDCPNKPCYLCKQPGHTTATCPFKIAPGHGCSPAATSEGPQSLLSALRDREVGRGCRSPAKGAAPATPSYQVDAAIYKLHSRRCCSLEFHPQRDNIVISGDKKGGIAIWDFEKVHERTIYTDIHNCVCNQIKMLPWLDSMSCCTTSSDGTARLVDLEVGSSRQLVDLNPQGWTQGGPWSMLYGCAVSAHHGTIYAGDSDGRLHLLDPRAAANGSQPMVMQLHKKDKIVSVDVHPLDPNMIMTAGNDRTARLFDIRAFSSSSNGQCAHNSSAATVERSSGSSSQTVAAAPSSGATAAEAGTSSGAATSGRKGRGAQASQQPRQAAPAGSRGKAAGAGAWAAKGELACMPHGGVGMGQGVSAKGKLLQLGLVLLVVNAAYFSRLTGRKILTTGQDNRIRVWDNLLSASSSPSREIVHSHDFNRYLTPFKAEWDPKDPTESRFIIGRYISEEFSGVALHPIDILDSSTGRILGELVDTNLTTISPVNKMHPRRDIIISGSSRSLYMWSPVRDDDDNGLQRSGSNSSAATATAAAAAAAAGGSSWAKASSHFVFFDAEPAGTKKASGAKRKGGPGKGKPGAEDDDDD